MAISLNLLLILKSKKRLFPKRLIIENQQPYLILQSSESQYFTTKSKGTIFCAFVHHLYFDIFQLRALFYFHFGVAHYFLVFTARVCFLHYNKNAKIILFALFF